jgi:hypothetical protein
MASCKTKRIDRKLRINVSGIMSVLLETIFNNIFRRQIDVRIVIDDILDTLEDSADACYPILSGFIVSAHSAMTTRKNVIAITSGDDLIQYYHDDKTLIWSELSRAEKDTLLNMYIIRPLKTEICSLASEMFANNNSFGLVQERTKTFFSEWRDSDVSGAIEIKLVADKDW